MFLQAKPHKMLCFGHRGAKGHELENTLLSIKKALSLGVDAIEIDIHNVENNLVVFHDFTLDRLTPYSGLLQTKSLAELKQITLANGEKIPLLQEVLDILPPHIGLNIEIKGQNCVAALIKTLQIYLKNKTRTYENTLISSFDHQQLEATQKANPQLLIGALLQNKVNIKALTKKLKLYSIHQSKGCVDLDFVNHVHENNLKIFVYTVNENVEIMKMQDLGVDGIFSDFPDRVITLQNK